MKYWLKKFIVHRRKRFYYKTILILSIFWFLLFDYIPIGFKPLFIQVNSPLITRLVMAAEPIQPIPETINLDVNKVELGKKLFHKKKLSSGDTLSCASCHNLSAAGTDRLVHSFGIMGDYFADRGNIKKSDLGRYNITGKESDRYVFKVPSLRNIALTPPYFHDGSTATLAEAVKIMGKYQLGRNLSTEDVNSIVRFLNTLTGEYKNNPL